MDNNLILLALLKLKSVSHDSDFPIYCPYFVIFLTEQFIISLFLSQTLEFLDPTPMINLQQIIKNSNQPKQCSFATYAYLQQPETLDFLKYLKLSQQDEGNCLNFNSEGDDFSKNNKKVKTFCFDGIYSHAQKMKYQCSKLIKEATRNAIYGENQTFFIYGTQQKCKDKILFGQSQNPGIFLCTLSQLFDLCHGLALQENVTIKFSCSLFNKAKFMDAFGGNGEYDIQYSKDYLEGGILHTVPQIIIRNVKTGLKLLNIVLKQVADQREENYTQNLILTLKLELDCKKNQQQTQVYCLSKISFIKLANPSINSSLKGVNKNNVWFVNLLNYIQTPIFGLNSSLSEINETDDNTKIQNDEFTTYLRQTYFKYSHKIFGFVSITNKMTSNQCLTALLFANHLTYLKIEPNKFIIDLPKITQEKEQIFISIFGKIVKKSQKLLGLWQQYVGLLENYMSEFNYLEFQYSLVIGEACEKLNKYIFTEELQDFFYAKKMHLETNQDLLQTYGNVKKIKNSIEMLRKKIIIEIGDKIEKNTLQKFFNLQFSMAHHFLLDDLQKTKSLVEENLKLYQKDISTQQSNKIENLSIPNKNTTENNLKQLTEKLKQKDAPKQISIHIEDEKQKQNKIKFADSVRPTASNSIQKSESIHKVNKKSITQSPIDNLECMFKNKNVGRGHKNSKESY